MNPVSKSLATPKADRFHPERVSLVLESLSLLRRLSGRILGHGVVPSQRIQDVMIELRDLLEDLSGDKAGNPPHPNSVQQVRAVDAFLQATPPPSETLRGMPLTGTQKMVLGDLVLYLEKAHEILFGVRTDPIPIRETREYVHNALEGLILLLTDVLDQDLYESYEMPDLIERLTASMPMSLVPPAPPEPARTTPTPDIAREAPPETSQTASDLISDAIARALNDDGSDWQLDSAGLLDAPDIRESEAKNLLNALGGTDLDDAAWSQIWIDESTEGAVTPQNLGSFSQEIQAIHSNEVQGLFFSISKTFCQPLPSLLANIQTKDLASEHLEGAYGIVLNISKSAEQFGYEELQQDLARIQRVLEHCQCDPELLTAREKVEILSAYDHLCLSFPSIFEPIEKQERGQRLKESIIIMEELRSIKGMGNKRITRLFAAGISNLRAFVEARLEDFSAVSSIDRDLAELILASFRPYRVLVASSVAPDVLETFRKEQQQILCKEVEQLSEAHYLYTEESRQPKFRDRRLKLRDVHRQREVAMSRIRCALAVLDEFDLIEAMRRIRYDKRLELLDQHLREKGLAWSPYQPKPS